MELSSQSQGSHTVASPSGQYIACITQATNKLRITSAYAPERFTDVPIRVQAKDITGLKWNNESDCIALLSAKHIEVIDLDDADHRIRLDNGSGGLGRFFAVDFVGPDHLLVVWEFGKAKMWDLSTGKGTDIGDVKLACDGRRWQIRPVRDSIPPRKSQPTLAVLSRVGADDVLNIYLPSVQKQLATVKLPTADAQCLSWSPDGRWLAVLDVSTAHLHAHFLTPDGHLFRSYPTAQGDDSFGLGIKVIVWAGDSKIVALTRYDGRIVLLNTRTFTPFAVIEHTTTIDQRASTPMEAQAPIWEEAVSAGGERSYTNAAQPFSPPLSRTKTSTEPIELGVAEATFSCDGSWLTTRDERMLNTIWIWNMSSLGPHAVIVQHSNVRRLHWHPTRPGELLFDCGEGIGYLFTVTSCNPPTPLLVAPSGSMSLSWLCTPSDSRTMVLSTAKSSSRILYPSGRPDPIEPKERLKPEADEASFDDGDSEDSLFDVLSGRKPMAPKTEQSYTERVDLEVAATEDEDTATIGLDDTFREKVGRRPQEVDPLDDSEIF